MNSRERGALSARATVAALFVLLVLLVGALVYVRLLPQLDQHKRVQFRDNDVGVQFFYSGEFQPASVTPDLAKTGTFFRAAAQENEALISVRQERGLGVLKLVGGRLLDTLVGTATRRYETQFPEYRKELYEERVVAKNPGAILEFTYLGADGRTRVRQRLVFIIVNDERAYFIASQAPDESFAKRRPDFELVESTFEVLPTQS